MIHRRSSSSIIAFIPDDAMDSCTESDSSWMGPENQLGLEPGELYDSRWDDDEVALDKKGEIKRYEAIAKN
jgi:hypothetical protein